MATALSIRVDPLAVHVERRPNLLERLVGPRAPMVETMRWEEVDTARAYKRDILTYDRICISLDSETRTLELHEDMEGWDAFLKTLPTSLPGCPDGDAVWRAVALPAFETKETVIFRRKPTADS